MIMLVLCDLRWIFITKHLNQRYILKICLLQRENLTIESEKKCVLRTQLTRKGGMFLPEEYPQEESPEVM